MHEIIVNLHIHSLYSDGSGTHREIAGAALRAGLDAVIVTDHNVLLKNMGGYLSLEGRKLLMIIGEEVHDRHRQPQKNHLLVIGCPVEMAPYASDPHRLLQAVRDSGGLAFLAHPTDPAAESFNEPDISWTDWSVADFTGIELWNGFSELKTVIPTKLHGVFHAFAPGFVAHGPPPESLRKWDELLQKGRFVAIGGSDAHALHLKMGPLRRVVFPYEFHFGAVNTHVMLSEALSGEANDDERAICTALSAGHCFIGYDRPFPTRGFRFTAHGRDGEAVMGDQISLGTGVTLQAYLPAFARIRMIRDGAVVQESGLAHALTYHALVPGVYRIEAFRRYLGQPRGWIFSNPIHVR